VNSIIKGFKPQTLLITDMEGNIISNKEKVLQKWSKYYEMHFELQDETDNDSREWWKTHMPTAEPYAEPPNDVHTEMAVSKLKYGKATGHDQILSEMIEEGGKEIKQLIYKLTLKIWEDKIIPQGQKYGVIHPIPKKGGT
jgi:hypothetical protein